MFKKRDHWPSKKRVVILVVLVVLAFDAVFLVHSDVSSIGVRESSSSNLHPNRLYSNAEIVEFLLFSTGPVVDDHQELRRSDAVSIANSDKRRREISVQLTSCMRALDQDFDPHFRDGIQSGDPYRFEQSIERFKADAKMWSSTRTLPRACPPAPQPPPAPSSDGGGGGWFKVQGDIVLWHVVAGANVAAAAVSVTVLGVINVAVAALQAALVATTVVVGAELVFVPILITYQFERQPAQFDTDEAIARLSSELKFDASK